MPVCPPVTVTAKMSHKSLGYPSGSSIPIKNHFCKGTFCTLQLPSFSSSPVLLSWLNYESFQVIPCWKACNSSLCSVKWTSSFPTWPISLMVEGPCLQIEGPYLQIEGTLHTTWPRSWPCCPSIGYTDSSLEITFIFQNQVHQPLLEALWVSSPTGDALPLVPNVLWLCSSCHL